MKVFISLQILILYPLLLLLLCSYFFFFFFFFFFLGFFMKHKFTQDKIESVKNLFIFQNDIIILISRPIIYMKISFIPFPKQGFARNRLIGYSSHKHDWPSTESNNIPCKASITLFISAISFEYFDNVIIKCSITSRRENLL